MIEAGNRWADLRDSDSEDDVVPTYDDAKPPAGAKPEVANAGVDADGFTKVPSKKTHRKTRHLDPVPYKHFKDTIGIAGRLRDAGVVRMHRGAIEFLLGPHAGCQLPFYSLAQRLKALERLEEDGFLLRRDSTRRYRTTKAVDEMLETKREAASAKRARQQGAAAAQRARQRKPEAKADADASVDPVFVPDETAQDHGPVGAAAPAAVPQVQYVPVVVTQQGFMAVMPYGAIPLGGYVAY